MSHGRRDGPRPAAVGACSFRQTGAADRATPLRDTLTMIDEMARQAESRGWALDLAILPECSFQFMDRDVGDIAETLDGPIVAAVAQTWKVRTWLRGEGTVRIDTWDVSTEQGTIEVWCKLLSPGDDGVSHAIVSVPGPEGMWLGKDQHAHVTFSFSSGWGRLSGTTATGS